MDFKSSIVVGRKGDLIMNKKRLCIIIGLLSAFIYLFILLVSIYIEINHIDVENGMFIPIAMTILYIPLVGIVTCVYKLNTHHYIIIYIICLYCAVGYLIGIIITYVECIKKIM